MLYYSSLYIGKNVEFLRRTNVINVIAVRVMGVVHPLSAIKGYRKKQK